MSDNSWKSLELGKEGTYFAKKEQEALERLAERPHPTKKRLSPITGEEMIQEVIVGVVIDRCPSSGGIWLDADELEQIIERISHAEQKSISVTGLFQKLLGKK